MRLLVVFFLSLLSVSARAQTAEDTVIFIFDGIEEGAKDETSVWGINSQTRERFEYKCVRVWKSVSLNKWTSAPVTNSDPRCQAEMLSISKLDNCRYVINRESDGQKYVDEFDFGGFKNYRVVRRLNDEAEVELLGSNLFKKSGGRQGDSYNIATKNLPRFERAVAYFRTNFCKGRAF